MSQHPEPSPHPVVEFAARGQARLDHLHSAASRPVWAMTGEELSTSALALARMATQLEALQLSVLAECERRGDVAGPGDRSAADWLARHTGARRSAARADLALGLALEADHPVLHEAFTAGRVSGEQVRIIKRSLDLLPDRGGFAVDAAQRSNAEATLVELAGRHDTRELAVLGARIYSVVCPEDADAYEGRRLEAQEARAARKVVLETWTDHQGLTHGRFRVPVLHGHMLKKALEAIMSPTRASAVGAETPEPAPKSDARPLAVRRGEAFCDLLERLSAAHLPTTGGGDATVVVTVSHDQLTEALDRAGVATLDTGGRVSAAEARRLACGHRILPAVLGGASVPLDLGRAQRLHSKAQRLAMSLRDGGCTSEGCDVPAAWCHAHHDLPWSQGGRTDLASGRLLCGPHHRRIHDPAYRHRITPDHQVQFYRRE